MADGISISNSISFIFVFLEGLLSFFSPCVIPLIPVYISYLAGNAKHEAEDGTITFQRKLVFFHTVFFVIGISFAFFILGMSFTLLGSFFSNQQSLFTRIGGILIILLGLIQIGFLEFKFLQRERKIHINFGNGNMNPFIAFVLGFTFSFAWTPCVGPALSSVLIMASGAGNSVLANLLILMYTAGFVIPFLLLGVFTTQVMNFLRSHKKLLKYTVKAGGVLLIVIGIMTFTGWMNGVSRYLNSFIPQSNSLYNDYQIEDNRSNSVNAETGTGNNVKEEETTKKSSKKIVPAYDFTLFDQYGNQHTLSDYKGKVVFLNFWATWCPPCKKEMPDIEALYKDFGLNQDDVIFLGVANPKTKASPSNSDIEKEEIIQFLQENQYTFPTVFDETGEIFDYYAISAFPTTFMINKEGNIFGYVPGMLTKDIMKNIIQQTIDSTK